MSTGKRLAGLLLTTALSMPTAIVAQDMGVAPGDDPGTEAAEVAAPSPIDPAQDQDYEEPDISIPGGAIVVTGRRIRDVSRSSGQVLSVLTAADIARTGDGDIAGALTRVTGLSVVGGGRVYVRGLGDRYSLALLNGLPLPSPEPLSRVVPLDIFPTNVIASSLVQKTYSANFPGEFGGGVINLTTRAVPQESFVKISASVGGDSITTFEDGLTYYGSDIDWLGFDNGNRDIPSNLAAFFASGERIEDTSIAIQEGIAAQLFPTNLVTLQRMNEVPVNWSASITGGTTFEVGDGTYFGVIATASIKNGWRNRFVRSQQASQDLSTINEDFSTFITDNNILVNGLLGFGLDFGENTIRWTNLYIRDTLKTARLATGTDFLAGDEGFDYASQNLAWFERQLIDSQVVGEFQFGALGLDLRGGYARTDREAPFNSTIDYVRTNLDNSYGDKYVVYVDNTNNLVPMTVSFDDLKEELWYGGIDLNYEVTDRLQATVGYAYSVTDRQSSSREFTIRAEGDFLDGSLIPAIGLRRPGDIINGASLAGFTFRVNETSQFPEFDAALTIHAGYGKFTFLPTDRLTLEAGIRYEDAEQTVELDQSIVNTPIVGATPTFLSNDYWLPGATVTWSATDDLQLRLAASRTLARPQFRELVEQTYFDPEGNRTYRGNPFLIDSRLTNFDARAEYYLGGLDKVSLAGFYKKIDNPIEAFITAQAGGGFITSYANAPEALLYGAEVEIQKSFPLYDWGDFLASKDLVIRGNYTYTQSEIRVQDGDFTFVPPTGAGDATQYFDNGDRLTGQSDHVANIQFSLEDQDRLEQISILLNYASDRVTSRGFEQPDVLEDPGLTVDFVARSEIEAFGRPFEVEFEVRNIFGRNNLEFQANEQNRIEINSYRVGTSFSIGLSAEF